MVEAVGYSVEDNSDIEKSIVNAAKKHYKDGNFDDAIRLYLGLLKTSASSKLYMDVGLCYYKKGDFDSAIENLTHATTLDINNSVAYSYIGNCYFRKLDAERAIENWMMARSISPKDEFVCLNLAIAYFAKNMMYESIFYYDKYLKYSNNKETSQYKSIQKNMNDLFRQANDYYIEAQQHKGLTAEENYLKAFKKYPIMREYSLALGDFYFNIRNYTNAIGYYELVLRENVPQNQSIYKKIAQAYEAVNDYRMAFCFYQRYLKFVISSQGEYLETSRKMNLLKKSIDSTASEVTLEIAKQHSKNNQYFEALIEYENYIILNPNDRDNYEYEINKLKSFVKSEEIITKTYLEKGKELLKKGEKTNANKYFTEVIHLSNPKTEEYKLAQKLINV